MVGVNGFLGHNYLLFTIFYIVNVKLNVLANPSFTNILCKYGLYKWLLNANPYVEV